MPVTRHAVGSYPTLSPLPLRAVCFLLRYLERYRCRPLTGVMSYGARTFLRSIASCDHLSYRKITSNNVVEFILICEIRQFSATFLILIATHVLIVLDRLLELFLSTLDFFVIKNT